MPARTASRLLSRLGLAALALHARSAAAQPSPPPAGAGAPRVIRSAYHDFRVEPVVEVVHPHSITFTPDGDLLVTERPGRLRIVRGGALLPEPVAGLPDILAIGHGATPQDGREQPGLRDVRLHPRFAENRLPYVSYVKPGKDGFGNLAVARGRFEHDRLVDVREIFHADAAGNGTNRSSMWGGRLAFDRAGYLLVTLGDRQWPPEGDLARHPAQDLRNHNGTTVRLRDDGTVPADNPFAGRAGARPETWTYGHRNAQGMAVHPVTGDVWQTEHGPQGGDELNLIQPGMNYGWPVVGYGVNYRTGRAIHAGTMQDGMEPPVHVWVPSIGTSGMVFYTGAAFPEWRHDLFVGGMSGQRLVRLRLEGRKVVEEEVLIRGMGRIREVAQGPDGALYVGIDADVRGADGAPTPIYRLVPVSRR